VAVKECVLYKVVSAHTAKACGRVEI